MPCRRCKLRAGKFREVVPAKLPMPTTFLCCTTPVPVEEARETLLLDLMRRVARKEEVALTPLYRQLSHTIRAFALRRLNDPIVADEIVVDTMYEVWPPVRGSIAGYDLGAGHRPPQDPGSATST
jgi:hypothetical protein